jgi:hypothetical protein
MRWVLSLAATSLLCLQSCGGSDDSGMAGRVNGGPASAADLSILFMGNSHTSVNDLTGMIYALHVSIAQREPACVAPVGQAWDLALTRHPTLVLHDADGNHSAPAGAFLTALILYATVTTLSPLDLPTLPFGIDSQTQATLRTVAAETVQTSPPRQWCSADPAL